MVNYEKIMVVKNYVNKYDIVFLQETRGFQTETLWKKQMGKKGKFSFFQKNARGVAVLVSEKFDLLKVLTDSKGRVASVLVQQGQTKLGATSFYFPNASNSREVQEDYLDTLKTVREHIEELKEETNYIFSSGDLNIILDATLDAEKPDVTTYQDLIDEVYEVLDSTSMTDAFRALNPETKAYTFAPIGSNPHCVFRRLDYSFVSDDLLPYIKEVEHRHCHFSDHKAVAVKVALGEKVKLRNFWRHNDSLLEIPEYVEHMKKAIEKGVKKYLNDIGLSSEEYADPKMLWEYVKYHIGRESRAFSKQLSKEKEKATECLAEHLQRLEVDPVTNKVDIEDTKERLNKLLLEEEKKVMFLSRVKYIEHNEKLTNFFLRRIKDNYKETNVIELKKRGKKLSQDECNKEIFEFYSELYRRRRTEKPSANLQAALDSLPKVVESKKPRLERTLTVGEIGTTLKTRMNPGKSPGSDGLTVAFYLKFWDQLKNHLLRCYEKSIIDGEMTDSQRKSIVRLIQKKGKDPTLLKNWRPISLMNVDAKIFSRLITARVEEVISDLCGEEQLAYIKNRNIMEGNRIIDYVITHLEMNQKEGFIVGFDFEKAFDSISHDFIITILKSFGFPSITISLFQTLYEKAESAVMNNGLTTDYFPLGRSCRQGDCLSPYLFILALEPLIRMIKADGRIKGINPLKHDLKVSLYADDMTGFIQGEEDMQALVKCIEDFGRSSGLRLNKEKTEVLHISKNPIQQFQHESLKTAKIVQYLKVTGVSYGRSADKCTVQRINFEEALSKMRNNFNSWNQRDVSILGRVMLAKCHGISMLQYLASIIEVPEWVTASAKKLIYRFVYKGVDKITRKVASKPIPQGGINLPMLDDMIAAAGVQWLRKSRIHPDRLWAKFIKNDLRKLGGVGSIHALRPQKDDVREGILEYNRYLRKCWQHLTKDDSLRGTAFLEQTVWKNRKFSFRIQRKISMLEGPRLTVKGYTRVGDFVDHDGRVIEADGGTGNLNLLEKMEWALAVKHIKSFLDKHNITLERGYTARGTADRENVYNDVSLSDNITEHPLERLKQGVIMKIMSQRKSEEFTPWHKKLRDEYDMDDSTLSLHYKNIITQGYDTKSRSFLFKMYAGLMYGNATLHKFGYVDSTACERCGEEKQDMKHLLVKCSAVEQFRQKIYTKIKKGFTEQEELLGCEEKGYSYVLLQMNRFIYQRKFLGLPLNEYEFYGSIRQARNIEEDIARRRNSLKKHHLKWNKICCTRIIS